MALYEDLKAITAQRMMHMAEDYNATDPAHHDSRNLVANLRADFPQLAVFVVSLGESLYGTRAEDVTDESDVTHFIYGMVVAYGLLARHAELEKIGE